MKKYRVTIELDTFEFIVSAKDKKEAKEKALNNLQKKKISTMIRKDGPIIRGKFLLMKNNSTQE